MRTAIQVRGMPELRARLARMRSRVPAAFEAATSEALELVKGRAQEILLAEVYDRPRGPFAPELTGELLMAFRAERLAPFGRSAWKADLANESPHAAFLELGTDDEGTGTHTVSGNPYLHFINAQTGAHVSAGEVTVHGIHPMHFLERALQENRAEVTAIFARRLAGLFA